MGILSEKKMKIVKPIFIIGVPRSGTTVIFEAVSSHENTGWLSNYVDKYPQMPQLSLLNRILDVPKIGWYLRGKKKQSRGLSARIRKELPHAVEAYSVWKQKCGEAFLFDYLTGERASEKEAKRLRKTIERVLFFHGKRRFLTKYTGPAKITYVHSIFPDAFFIHVVRDPRAVASSLLNVKFWKNRAGDSKPWWRNGLKQEYIEEWEKTGRAPAALAAIQWKQIIESAWEESRMIPASQYIEVKYEKFIASPIETLEDLFQKVELPFSNIVQRYVNSIGKVKTANDKFKKYLTKSDIEIIEKITNRVAKRAGY